MSMTFATKTVHQKGINELITGTGTAGQAGSSTAAYVPSLWTFNTGVTPVAGDVLTIKVPVAGVNSGVWMSVDNGTNYYPVAIQGTTRFQSEFGVNYLLTVVYETGINTTTYGTTKDGAAKGASTSTYTGDRWRVLNFYNTNTTYSPASLGFGYGTCSTAEATVAKVVTLSSYALVTGGFVTVKFSYAVPASATMNINSKGAKAIYYNGAAITAGIIKAGDFATFVYSGQYHLIAIHRTACIAGVDQTATTTNAAYEVLFSATADNTTRTEGARKTSTFKYNPSTKALTTGGTVDGYALQSMSEKTAGALTWGDVYAGS